MTVATSKRLTRAQEAKLVEAIAKKNETGETWFEIASRFGVSKSLAKRLWQAHRATHGPAVTGRPRSKGGRIPVEDADVLAVKRDLMYQPSEPIQVRVEMKVKVPSGHYDGIHAIAAATGKTVYKIMETVIGRYLHKKYQGKTPK